MSIFINELGFIFVLFVFQLLNHSAEPSTQLWEGTAPLLRVGARPPVPPSGYGPVEPSHPLLGAQLFTGGPGPLGPLAGYRYGP